MSPEPEDRSNRDCSAAEVSIARLGAENLGKAEENCRLFWKMAGARPDLKEFLEDPQCIMLAAEVGGEHAGQIVGYILRRWDEKPPMLFLYSIDVAERFRRNGVARRLVREFLRLGKEQGCGTSFVMTNEGNVPAMELYRSAGGIRANQDDVLFQWKL
ncbi:MAG TPA: GNAT family N-acetyltransferase [Candidatus Sabulitectum sp.]|nr:GNAT family N-acetyltransferase [Candidatus Sabulitectum sp.]HPJ28544.1 GNAT family N-acetyltransferase [Candidatus Sabulitectum sp.]HPR23463.1 GNAT family N-acetyltransferase [Candidatus Sabulitectum sp.]